VKGGRAIPSRVTPRKGAGPSGRDGSAGKAAGKTAGKTAGKAAGWVGLVAGAVAAGAVAERTLVRRLRAQPDPAAGEPFGPIEGRPATVIASDGVPLHVEEIGAPDAPLTVVFAHGYSVSMNSWYYQRRDLAGDDVRLVFYDQRAHGRSGPSSEASCTIDQLGEDLFAVIRDRVPGGPLVVVGHSMGGMSVLALAQEHPDLFHGRVTGVGLLSTSAGDLATVTFGLPAALVSLVRHALPGLSVGMRRVPPALERRRLAGSDIGWILTRRVGFGALDTAPSLVSFLEREVASTPLPVIASFLPTLIDHNKLAATRFLRDTPTLLLVGDADVMTPLEHSRTIARELPDAELVIVPGAGHAVILERPEIVNAHLRWLIEAGAQGLDGRPVVPRARDGGVPKTPSDH
jgi:pimeloyl-ACP methyl ester carboxylesterase